tara:strand:- start:76 stop:702 length:627 start_codon:yes stop_codon:yes gene_type:complete
MEKNKKLDMNKHVVDTLNKYEDGADIQQQVINYSPNKAVPKRIAQVAYEEAIQKNKKILPAKPDPSKGKIKPFDNNDSSTYPKNQKENLNTWDLMVKSARNEIKKGNYSEMREIKNTLMNDYKRSGGQWMNDEEKKLIGKYKPKYSGEPMKLDLNMDIASSRLNLEKKRELVRNMNQEIDVERKNFQKKLRGEKNQGLASIINSIEEI